jgi:hypothetical protein
MLHEYYRYLFERPIGIKRRGIQDSRAGYMIRILNKIREHIKKRIEKMKTGQDKNTN